jgi:hypothetical protein
MQLWIQAPFRDASLLMNAESYGFERIDGVPVPEIVIVNRTIFLNHVNAESVLDKMYAHAGLPG